VPLRPTIGTPQHRPTSAHACIETPVLVHSLGAAVVIHTVFGRVSVVCIVSLKDLTLHGVALAQSDLLADCSIHMSHVPLLCSTSIACTALES